jgi:hypothetical protein
MALWILAHGNGVDELVVLASGMALAVRLLVAHRRTPTTLRRPLVSEQQPDRPADDDQFDPPPPTAATWTPASAATRTSPSRP